MSFLSRLFSPSQRRHEQQMKQRFSEDEKKGRKWGALLIILPKLDWQPSKAADLMAAFYRMQNYTGLTFQINIGRGLEDDAAPSARWKIILYEDLIDSTKRLINSVYPQAEVYPTSPSFTNRKPLEAEFFSTVPFFAPFIDVDDCKVDPLAQVLGTLTHLEPADRIWLELVMVESSHDFNQEGLKMVHRDQGNYALHALLSAMATRGKVILPAVSKPANLYESPYQRQFEDKVNSTLRPFRYLIQMASYDKSREEMLLSAVSQTMTVFERSPGNMLTTSSKGNLLVLTAKEAAAFWHLPSEEITIPGIDWVPATKTPLPNELQGKKEGVRLGEHSYQANTQPVYLAMPDRVTHMNIVGKTRVGKTTLMHNLIHQDIQAGRGVGVIDPHGDLVKAILETSILPEREKDVILFDLADQKRLIPLNLLYVPPGVPPHAAVGAMLGVMKKIFADQWSQTRMEDALYAALAVLVTVPGATIRDIPRLFFEADYRASVLAQTNDSVALEFWRDDFERMSESYQMEVARPILNRIRTFYRNPVIEQVVAQPNSLDIKYIMAQGKILLVSLAGEATQADAGTLGALLISKLQMAAMSRTTQRRMFYLYIDEVQNFITTSLSTMFSEAAKYGLSLTVANQYLRQLEGGTLDAIIGNTGTTIMFAMGNQDAKDLGQYIKPTFDSQTLLNLDRFEAIIKMQYQGKTLPAFGINTLPAPIAISRGKQIARLVSKASDLIQTAQKSASPECREFCIEKYKVRKTAFVEYLHDWVELHPEDEQQFSELNTLLTREFWEYYNTPERTKDAPTYIYEKFLLEQQINTFIPLTSHGLMRGPQPSVQSTNQVPDLKL